MISIEKRCKITSFEAKRGIKWAYIVFQKALFVLFKNMRMSN